MTLARYRAASRSVSKVFDGWRRSPAAVGASWIALYAIVPFFRWIFLMLPRIGRMTSLTPPAPPADHGSAVDRAGQVDGVLDAKRRSSHRPRPSTFICAVWRPHAGASSLLRDPFLSTCNPRTYKGLP